MEPISAIALSLALGAGAVAGKTVVSELVKDAYASLKNLVKSRYPKVSVEQVGPENLVHPFGTGRGSGRHPKSIAYFPQITVS